MPKHYRPAGKKKEGNVAKYITRTKALRQLQISLQNFRKLCILKGIFPREPKKKVEGNHKTYYHVKDIAFLAHEPILETLRDKRVHEKKVNKALAKKNKPGAERLLTRQPTYKLDKILLERFPKFVDALRELDDCLSMVHLFAALPAVEREHIGVNRIRTCRRLSHEWQAYVSRTHKLRKTFITVKGTYYQAEVQGQKITWLVPHALQQVISDDVDYNVMKTFLEVYESLLGFVNCQLYHSISMKYPPILDPRLEALAADLYALTRDFTANSRALEVPTVGSSEPEKAEVGNKSPQDEKTVRTAQLQHQVAMNQPGTLMHLVEEATSEDNDDEETRECKNLFKNSKFFLSREASRESLLFVIPAFGGVVSWEGDGAPFDATDEGITHQIVDRPTQGHLFLSRKYVQPQWVFDCVNARIILPTDAYMVGRVPPPHLSPFVDNEGEGYVPEYAETIKRLQSAAKRQIMPMPGVDNQDVEDPQNLLVEGIISRNEANEANQRKRKMAILEKQYHDELKMEQEGVPYTASLSRAIDSNSVEETEQKAKDEEMLNEPMNSRKKRGLIKAIKIGKEKKRAKIENLKKRAAAAKKAI